jgi:hypothetical protein
MPTSRPRTSIFGAVVGVCAATVAFAQTPAPQPQSQPAQSAPAATPAPPPSLSDLARQEAARRKGVKAAKVYSNKDLKPEDHPPAAEGGTPSDAASGGASAAADQSGPAGTKAAKATGEAQPEEHDEQYWRTRMTDAQETLRRNETFVEALQSRINGLSADFAARDDPYQRAQIGDERQKALAELDRLTKEIDQNKKAIADIEDEARRAGVPAGWVR